MKKQKETVICCVEDMKKYNIGNALCYSGLIAAGAAILIAYVGNRIRINAFYNGTIIGPECMKEDFVKVIDEIRTFTKSAEES